MLDLHHFIHGGAILVLFVGAVKSARAESYSRSHVAQDDWPALCSGRTAEP